MSVHDFNARDKYPTLSDAFCEGREYIDPDADPVFDELEARRAQRSHRLARQQERRAQRRLYPVRPDSQVTRLPHRRHHDDGPLEAA